MCKERARRPKNNKKYINVVNLDKYPITSISNIELAMVLLQLLSTLCYVFPMYKIVSCRFGAYGCIPILFLSRSLLDSRTVSLIGGSSLSVFLSNCNLL